MKTISFARKILLAIFVLLPLAGISATMPMLSKPADETPLDISISVLTVACIGYIAVKVVERKKKTS